MIKKKGGDKLLPPAVSRRVHKAVVGTLREITDFQIKLLGILAAEKRAEEKNDA